MSPTEHFREPALAYARKDFPLLSDALTVGQALDTILEHGLGEQIIYFYVVDAEGRLAGVLPTRRLLTTPRDVRIAEVMVRRLVTLPSTATVYDACELFVRYKFLAFPIVDEEMNVQGVVDVNLFTDELITFNQGDSDRLGDVFETIGFRYAQVREASPFRAFRFRFPWLLATIGSGTLSALLAGVFEATLAESLVIAFFLTLVSGLAESVSMQAMTITIQALNVAQPSLQWYSKALRRELMTAALLGAGCGAIVYAIVWLWQGDAPAAITISLSILSALLIACFVGLSVPSALHALKLDPKIAAGPVTLALTDVVTLLFYFSLASLIL